MRSFLLSLAVLATVIAALPVLTRDESLSTRHVMSLDEISRDDMSAAYQDEIDAADAKDILGE